LVCDFCQFTESTLAWRNWGSSEKGNIWYFSLILCRMNVCKMGFFFFLVASTEKQRKFNLI
jgi:hypothetical protein